VFEFSRTFAILLLITGLGLSAVALLLLVGGFSWFGRLPGDLRIRTDRSIILLPFTSMLVISVVLTLIVNVIRRLL
jgi:hypothetical protein